MGGKASLSLATVTLRVATSASLRRERLAMGMAALWLRRGERGKDGETNVGTALHITTNCPRGAGPRNVHSTRLQYGYGVPIRAR